MAAVSRKARKAAELDEAALVEQMEKAGPRGEQLRQLVRKHPAPQEWYDQDAHIAKTPKRRR